MFRFKQFSIEQSHTPMKVGTDGVLLGAWTSIQGDERRVLDIGTGTGLIALMVAQRTSTISTSIDAVEIDEASACQARDNIEHSPWRDRVEVYHSDINNFKRDELSNGGYDLIVSNPPYFVDSLQSPDSRRSTARHTTELSFAELVASVKRLLNPEGRFALILPTVEATLFDRASEGILSLSRRCEVYSRPGSGVKRVMSEYRLSSTQPPSTQPPSTQQLSTPKYETLLIETSEHLQYTDEYRALTRDFYLKF